MKNIIELALENGVYSVALSRPPEVTGPDKPTAEMLAQSVARILSGYSPAFGGVFHYLAHHLALETGGKILKVVDNSPNPPGAIY